MRRRMASIAVATAIGLFATSVHATEEPGNEATAGLGETTVAESTQRRLHSLAQELGRIANLHGPDAITLQVGLLFHTISAGAVGASEVRVVGPSPQAGPAFLEVDVDTGLIFDEDGSTPRSRLGRIWEDIATPALDGMESFKTEPAGLELVFAFGTQRFATLTGHKADPAEPFEAGSFRIEIPQEVLADLAAGALAAGDALARCRVSDGDRVMSVPD